MNDPTHAVSIWIEGDNLMVRFPDQQLIPIPANEPGRLINILRLRASAKRRPSIGAPGCPVAHDIERREDERDYERAVQEFKKRKAEELLKLIGL